MCGELWEIRVQTGSDSGSRQLLQVIGSFFLMLGAGFVLDRALPSVGWVLVLTGAGLLVWAARMSQAAVTGSAPQVTGTEAGRDAQPPAHTP
ncbi:MAG: hypothetical protein KatS3mg077_0390 [Candidatus Binatia bacterium]|nr:MAG: hypothetical protein KatS3mg077_0390 [Candidatus Binatia bacterium]